MLILEDLYVGDVRPNERSFKRNSQYAEALDELVKVGDELTAKLNEEEKELFEDFMDAQRAESGETERAFRRNGAPIPNQTA